MSFRFLVYEVYLGGYDRSTYKSFRFKASLPSLSSPLPITAKVMPELCYNVFGGTAGGLVRRSKTFFFVG